MRGQNEIYGGKHGSLFTVEAEAVTDGERLAIACYRRRFEMRI
ncbi:hypothetical protein SETIT_7G098600v2 [Setaria italica]|uniref:Uncharacterized protein n=2 Tax=Setaria TaxID=4554 RepID=A0A368RVR3_SETIT|nr:hypothetical protein SETIT_7G098600v2 [Setaria italica]TKW04394.1 hypothetical protein SEVIR_7G106500v2 [Setaria viridis]